MMGKKKLSEIHREVAALLGRLPGRSPRAWLDREIASATGDRNRDVETLEMLCAALERSARPAREPKARRRPARP
jgi:hypothetical protein